MAGVLPANISFFMQRLAGVSSSHFKISPQGSPEATANKIVRFELPSNTLINMRNIRFFFNAQTEGSSAGGRLPNKIDSLIERVAIYMGGVLVQNNFNKYNVLRHVKDAIQGDKCPAVHGHPEIVRETSYHDGSTLAGTANESYTDKDDMFCVDYFEGLLGSIEPSIIDTGLLPQITLEITLAEDAVCPAVSGVLASAGVDKNGAQLDVASSITKASGTAATFKLTNMSLQVEVLGLATSVLDQLVESRIASVGYLSLPFKNYYTYSSTTGAGGGTTRFSANSASLDRVWIAYRNTGFATTPAAVHNVKGYKQGSSFEFLPRIKAQVNNASNVDGTTLAIDEVAGGTLKVGDFVYSPEMTQLEGIPRITALAADGDSATNTLTLATKITINDNKALHFGREVAGVPTFNSGGVLDTNKEKYISQYFRFQEELSGSSEAKYQLQVNGASIPAYKMNRNEFYEITKASADAYRTDKEMSLAQYTDSFFVQCLRFNLEGSDMTRLASGLDTRAVSAQMAIETEGTKSQHLDIFVECTSELRVGSGRSIEVIA
jgi:hypothetical protein